MASRALYVATYYDASTACFANCTYVSQLFGLTLGLVPAGDIDKAWAVCMDWFGPNATQAQGKANHFGGGIISLKYLYPQLTVRGLTGLGLRMHLQYDEPPGFGYWIANNATTLWEAYDMTSTVGGDSRNHSEGARACAVARFLLPLRRHRPVPPTRAPQSCLARPGRGTTSSSPAWTERWLHSWKYGNVRGPDWHSRVLTYWPSRDISSNQRCDQISASERPGCSAASRRATPASTWRMASRT